MAEWLRQVARLAGPRSAAVHGGRTLVRHAGPAYEAQCAGDDISAWRYTLQAAVEA